MPRQPSAVTLRIRAMAKVERLKDKIANKIESETLRREKYENSLDSLRDELLKAERAAAPEHADDMSPVG